MVQTLSAGTDQWDGLLPGGVALSNARGAHGPATAEWAVAALLYFIRKLEEFARSQTTGTWARLTADTLDGARVLVLGAGDIGDNVRRRLEPFGARVTMVGRTLRPGVRAVSELPDLLGDQDAVIAVVPLTADTRGMIDSSFLAQMRDGAILVNAARGPVVDTKALHEELHNGRLRAALDVTDPEPLPPDHPLWRAPGVLITPHIGGETQGAKDRAWAVAARQIIRLATGKTPDNVVEVRRYP
jgi:phosphoglycerate dehydrogenase-like enzyme